MALKAREAEDVIQRAQETGKPLNTQLDVPLEVLYGRANRVIAIRYRLSTTNVCLLARVSLFTHFMLTRCLNTDASYANEVRKRQRLRTRVVYS